MGNTLQTAPAPGKLGTFGGVFAPSLLTILGLVLFLRVGFVTGNVGLLAMLAILGLSTAVSLLTTISLAALATNLRVGGGGVYFLISRTLGPTFGGAIGLVLYLAMSVSVAFYAIGLGEAVTSAIGSTNTNMPRLIAAGTIVGLLGLAWLGADIATRLQYLVLVCLVIAIAGYLLGVVGDVTPSNLPDNLWSPPGGSSFWVSFAIFFPAITGFTQGVAMSGDLRTPSRSISSGTFSAIGVSTVVYVVVIFTLAMAVPLEELRDDTSIMRRLSLRPWLLDLGVIAATLSSAIASMMGAPRTLQRLAADRLVKPLEPFAKGAGPSANPRNGVLLTTAIALVTVALGDLDVVAPIISMFFLASYGMINYATYSEARAASTSFRPRFRFFDWRLSLLGTIACLGVILAIDPVAGALAGIAILILYRYLEKSVTAVRWTDSTRGFHTSEVRSHLQRVDVHTDDGRDWRPCTVAFVPRDHVRRSRLTTVASWIEGGAGFTTVARIVPGDGAVVRKQAKKVESELMRELAELGPTMYGRVLVAKSLGDGVAAMLQAHGIGPIQPNLALFSWQHDLDDTSSELNYAAMVQAGVRYGCSVAILNASDRNWHAMPATGRKSKAPPRIMVWWHDDYSGELLTMLAWLCTRHETWKRSSIDVWVASDTTTCDPAAEVERVRELLDDARLPATVAGFASPDELTTKAATADLVFAPARIRRGEPLGPGDVPIRQVVDDLPLAIFVHPVNAVGLDVQPDDAVSASLAIAHDRATQLSTQADTLSETAGTLMVQAEILRMTSNGSGPVSNELASAEKAATAAQRKYLDVRTRADAAWRAVHKIDPSFNDGALDPTLWHRSPDGAQRRD